jgi:hypothetical protein
MARPGGRLPAGDLRPPAGQARSSCGFCESTHGQPPGVCQDTDDHCKGTWPHFVKPTEDNDTGSWTCACFAAGHPGRKEKKKS